MNGRYHYLDKLRFFYFARGSLFETRAAFTAAHALGYTTSAQQEWAHSTEAEALCSLNGYIAFIRSQRQGQEEFGDKALHEEPVQYYPALSDVPRSLIPNHQYSLPNPQKESTVTARRPLAVIAIGGNSLIRDKARISVPDQYAAAKETCTHIADMIAQGWNVAIGHGNGPQVGFILRRSEIAHKVAGMHEVPLDFCGADSQGALGYTLQQNLWNEFRRRRMNRIVATVVTQVLVDRDDPAFQNPTKPIGSFLTEEEAQERARQDGWVVVEDAGRGWRRVVPSPYPRRIVELDVIKELLRAGVITIAIGGGGIPVIENENGDLVGVEAVIDKDIAAALLAREIKADLFLISTAVEKVALNYNKPDQMWLDRLTAAEAKRYYDEGHFPPGSMGPKIEAALDYLESGGKQVIITNPENITRALRGETGTSIVP